MSFETPAGVLLTILFVIPGFIWKKVAQASSPYARTDRIEFLDCIALSCLNYLVALLPMCLLLHYWPPGLDPRIPGTLVSHVSYLLLWFLLVFALPVICGLGTSKATSRAGLRSFFGRFGVSILHPAPTAWDYAFARKDRYWARIELRDGTRLVGLFGSNSLASSKPEERDIFLEAVMEYNDEDATYEPIPRSAGVWISAENMKTLAFFTTDGNGDGTAEVQESPRD